jgi:hypothetical protein
MPLWTCGNTTAIIRFAPSASREPDSHETAEQEARAARIRAKAAKYKNRIADDHPSVVEPF